MRNISIDDSRLTHKSGNNKSFLSAVSTIVNDETQQDRLPDFGHQRSDQVFGATQQINSQEEAKDIEEGILDAMENFDDSGVLIKEAPYGQTVSGN